MDVPSPRRFAKLRIFWNGVCVLGTTITTIVQGADRAAQHVLRLIAAKFYKASAMIAVDLPDETATIALAARVSALAAPGDVIALKGDLGAGKTTFARGFIRARCGPDEEVPSPTFTLVQVYELDPTAIWHFDLYRLASPREAWELGIEDAFSMAISLIEWPERLGSVLPSRRLEIALTFTARPGARQALLDPGGGWQARLTAITAEA